MSVSKGRLINTASGVVGGYAPLDANLRIPATYLSTNPTTSGALATSSPASGTAFQPSSTRDTHVTVSLTFNPTGIATATCTVALSPDNSTFSTLVVKTLPALATLAGSIDEVSVFCPAGWWIKLTAVNVTLGVATIW